MAVQQSNPQFDNRMRAIPRLGIAGRSKDTPFWRGTIISENEDFKDGLLTVNFLFNPSTISVNHQQGYNLSQSQMSTDGNIVGAQGIGTLTFDVLFDRTYELYSGGGKNSDSPAQRGVLADVEAVYNVTGAYDISAKGSKRKELRAMQPNPCSFYFGGTADSFIEDNSLDYYGIVTGLSITYTHFSRDMVPQRCAMSFNVDLAPKP
ncbi:hypothetical protein [Streptomyces sp. BH105]|uniref:CIS tube protein n=1 Tax=Streptomyces sp. BH105 TaxID=3410408 RepID=UPI003CFB295C